MEAWFSTRFSALPDRVQNVLGNPGPWMCLATNILGAIGMQYELLAREPAIAALFFAGLTINSVAAGWGFSPLVRRHSSPAPDGRPLKLNAAGNLALGFGGVMRGNVWTGIATILWAGSAYTWGTLVEQQRRASESTPTSAR